MGIGQFDSIVNSLWLYLVDIILGGTVLQGVIYFSTNVWLTVACQAGAASLKGVDEHDFINFLSNVIP